MPEEKPTIHRVKATIRLPGPGCPDGQISEGAFILTDGVVTLCHLDNPTPVRDAEGRTYTRTLQAPTNTFADAEEQAKLLTVDFRKAIRGGRAAGFDRGPLPYKKIGWC
jgi:hypothetical protein